MKKIICLIMLSIFALPIYASENFSDNLTVPHSFSSGDTISSSQINENFEKIFVIVIEFLCFDEKNE